MATQSQVKSKRQEFNAAGYPQFPVRFEGVTVRCFLLPQTLEPALPHFAFQMVTEGFDHTSDECMDAVNELAVFGVADSIPEDFRQLIATHEMYEYLFGMTCPEIAAKEIELSKTLGSRQAAYLELRCNFFKNLLAYARGKSGYSAEKKIEFHEAWNHFLAAT